MSIEPFKRLIESWDLLEQENEDLRDRIRRLELPKPPGPKPPEPPGSKIPLVPLEEPPLLYNRGSWDKNTDQQVSSLLLPDGTLRVSIAQGKQSKSRVIRRDFGLHDPDSKGHKREPDRTWRRYELKVKIPEDYSGRGELCTLGLKFHTHSARDPAYLAFIAWSTTVRWRVNHPDGEGRHDYGEAPIRKGHTYALAVEAFWSQGADGRLKAWTDGEIMLDYKGPNYSRDEVLPPYLLVGCYFPSAIEEFSEVFEFSELRVGDL